MAGSALRTANRASGRRLQLLESQAMGLMQFMLQCNTNCTIWLIFRHKFIQVCIRSTQIHVNSGQLMIVPPMYLAGFPTFLWYMQGLRV